jgi:hypothetical protein
MNVVAIVKMEKDKLFVYVVERVESLKSKNLKRIYGMLGGPTFKGRGELHLSVFIVQILLLEEL